MKTPQEWVQWAKKNHAQGEGLFAVIQHDARETSESERQFAQGRMENQRNQRMLMQLALENARTALISGRHDPDKWIEIRDGAIAIIDSALSSKHTEHNPLLPGLHEAMRLMKLEETNDLGVCRVVAKIEELEG